MIGNLAVATFMVGLTVTIHFAGLLGLVWFLRASTAIAFARTKAPSARAPSSSSSCWA